ncbi:hypothetical protein U9M48_026879 [Paspalum notatum var. saurae]|uniref:GRF-type domain-containing protein n=1 Tax=Paspalum notatum var. saurae TaxID=547442 RepID=A0AAQ3TTM2_PASNO
MGDSSSWASRVSARSGNRGAVAERLGSPVPYREGPLSYQPAVMCHCRMKASRWISWSEDNPGRRYYRYSRARVRFRLLNSVILSAGDCGFYEWVDDEHSTFLKDLLLDLRDAVWSLRKENNELKMVAGTHDGCNWEMKKQMERVERENMELKQALKTKEEKMEEKCRYWLLGEMEMEGAVQ